MIDFRGIQNMVTGQTPFYILIILAILAYLHKNSTVEMTRPRVIFLGFWSLYVLSMFISMLVNRDFILPETLVMILLTVIFFYKMPRALLQEHNILLDTL